MLASLQSTSSIVYENKLVLLLQDRSSPLHRKQCFRWRYVILLGFRQSKSCIYRHGVSGDPLLDIEGIHIPSLSPGHDDGLCHIIRAKAGNLLSL